MTFVIVCHFRSKAHGDKLSDWPATRLPVQFTEIVVARNFSSSHRNHTFVSKTRKDYYHVELERILYLCTMSSYYYILSFFFFFHFSLLIKNKFEAYSNTIISIFHSTLNFQFTFRFHLVSMRFQRESAKIDSNGFIRTRSRQ